MKMKDEYKIRRWLDNRYHLNTEKTFKEDKFEIESWKLFQVHPNWMTDGSKPIMTSETHTDKELMKFAKKNKIYNLNISQSFVLVIIAWINVLISIINSIFLSSTFIRGFMYGINFVIFISSIINSILLSHNRKINDKEFKEKMKFLEENYKKRILKMEEQNRFKKAIINKNVEHQGIGGKEITLEKELSVKYFLDTNLNEMTIGMANFAKRRLDFIDEKNENKKVYYGHVGDFGYFVAEDEIEMI